MERVEVVPLSLWALAGTATVGLLLWKNERRLRSLQDSQRGTVRVLACFDKFKGSLDAESVGAAVLKGINDRYPGRVVSVCIPMSDGGDGFVQALKGPLELEMVAVEVTGPCGTPVVAEYGRSRKEGCDHVAVVEMAAASGLALVPEGKKDPLHTTSRGTGELLMDAYRNGCTRLVVGIGGSATNDGGLGCLQALGLKAIIGGKEHTSPICGGELIKVEALEMPEEGLLPGATLDIACDVDNPFVGEEGATYVYSKQKGATREMQDSLEEGMRHIAALYKGLLPRHMDVAGMPGAGAAGGLAGGLITALDSKLARGVEVVSEALQLEKAIAEADLVLSGEGRYDAQTLHGKVVSEVQALAAKHGKPVVIVCGGKQDIPKELDHHIYDLLSSFDMHTSMTQTALCLARLVYAKAPLFPVLRDLQV